MNNRSPKCASEGLRAFTRGNMLAKSGSVAESLRAAKNVAESATKTVH